MPEDPIDFQPGAELKGTPYRVVRKIGAGGMGAVFEVEHSRLKKRMTAKILLPGLRTRQDFVVRMEREAQTAARIAHPNIVQVHDLGVTDDGIPFFIMEKLEGSDLRKLLRTRRYLDVSDALTIVEDVLEALAHAHREGVVHRDIKPENIFLARSGVGTVTKILDFGIVHVMDDQKNLTGRRFLGTCQYAAREQLQGHKPTEKTDIYAVGCVLFELITGRRPFVGPTTTDFIRQHMNDEAPRLSSLIQGIPSELDALVTSSLEKDPALRPISALWFASQLHRIQLSAANVVLAEANTTEEMLLTAITQGAASSNPIVAAAKGEPDTDKDPGLVAGLGETTPEPRGGAAPATLHARGKTEPLHLSPPPPTSEERFRGARTRTGKPVELVKTEELSESGGDVVVGVAARSAAWTNLLDERPRRGPSHASDASSVVLPMRSLIPNGPWARRAIIAAPAVVGAALAIFILARGLGGDPAQEPAAVASTLARPAGAPPTVFAAAPAVSPGQAAAQAGAPTSTPTEAVDAGLAPISSARSAATSRARKTPAFEAPERTLGSPSAPPPPVAPPDPRPSQPPPPTSAPQRDDLMRTF